MAREPSGNTEVRPLENNGAAAQLSHQAASTDTSALLLRLWRAACPEQDLPTRRSESAGNRYLATRSRGTSPTVLFDPAYYFSQLPVFLRQTVDPLVHYLQSGWLLGLSPHPLFDSSFVAEQLGITSWTAPPLLVYFETSGEISAHPLFEVDVYANHVSLDFAKYARLFEMFIDAWPHCRAPFSRLFSLRYYERLEPAVRYGKVNPLLHYVSTDVARRRDANPMIHNRWYDSTYPSKPGQPRDPLVRFAQLGIKEGHLPNPFAPRELRLQDPDSYVLPELVLQYVDARASDEWLTKPGAEGLSSSVSIANLHQPEVSKVPLSTVTSKIGPTVAVALPAQQTISVRPSGRVSD